MESMYQLAYGLFVSFVLMEIGLLFTIEALANSLNVNGDIFAITIARPPPGHFSVIFIGLGSSVRLSGLCTGFSPCVLNVLCAQSL